MMMLLVPKKYKIEVNGKVYNIGNWIDNQRRIYNKKK